MKKFILSLLVISLCLSLAACDIYDTVNDIIDEVLKPSDAEAEQFTAHKNQVTKDAFQKQYAQAFNNR